MPSSPPESALPPPASVGGAPPWLAKPAALDLLHPEPVARVDRAALKEAMTFAFASGVSGGLFADGLERAAVPPSTWDPQAFAKDLFLADFVARCFRIRIGGHEYLPCRQHLFRILANPPADPAVTAFRQGIAGELVASPALRQAFEALYTTLVRFRGALEGATAAKKYDPNRRQLELLGLAKEAVDRMADGFAGATSGLRRLGAFGQRVRASDGYRALADLLRYDDELATVTLRVRVGADGRIRRLELLDLRENRDNPFVAGPLRRFASRIELVARGYRFGEGEVMALLLDAVFEGVDDEVVDFVQLLGEMEFYLGALGFRDLAAHAGLAANLPEIAPREGERVFEGLFNPLLVSHGVRAVPCRVATPRAGSTVLVTGPNSGGKTRLLQSVGLLQVLAQNGVFVPAERARIPFATSLVVSLLQETRADQAEGRLGMELLRIRSLFEQLAPGAMVLLDELCSGTNPSEGEEIFELVVSLLSELAPQAFITTHFLTCAARLAEKPEPWLQFLQVELDAKQEPTYQFVPGVARTSLAERAAARLGVSREQLAALIRDKPRPGAPPAPPPRPDRRVS